MSGQRASDQSKREQLIAAVLRASRESSTIAVFFHASMADRMGLGATEEKTLSLLGRLGSMTAGEIASQTGLTTPSVTSLLDRLEGKGMVRRVRDPHDRRRVIVEPDPERMEELNRMFYSVQETFQDLLSAYSDEQLEAIADFLTRSVQSSQELIAALRKKDED
ncbi:MarR family winged helix-turn-helix transcriptional regulator [Dictyobacter aurantiacus]|uniref:Putative HTH-type transcriptional regulator YcgE n=1 Tax=Dictyobacter aurantiacus TaxID=1936993 RepID=A0A401ZJR7_9CHLR|nr:MarR family transcriptional regulator [Dictyobacter aurantiacus]GCE07068.1 putative HTH-type transcriptional regulator YcgE [Dictyobacter aurantiacus]